MSNYGNPVEMRVAIQALRFELAYKLFGIAASSGSSDALATDADDLLERLVSDVDNEMLSISIDKGLPFVSYAKTPADRWNSERRMSVSLMRFLKTRLGLNEVRCTALVAAVTREVPADLPIQAATDPFSYPV